MLFIGNSLTYVHDLPDIVERLGALTGDTIRTATLAKPNYALLDHLADGGAKSAIQRERWDVVVLQQGSSALTEGRTWLYAGVDSLAPYIRAAGGTPALYEVWPTSDRAFDVPKVRESYLTAAQRVNGRFYPAGTAWQAAWLRDPTLALYEPDGLHPSATGSFLAALVMYEQLTGKDAGALPAVAYADGALARETTERQQRNNRETTEGLDGGASLCCLSVVSLLSLCCFSRKPAPAEPRSLLLCLGPATIPGTADRWRTSRGGRRRRAPAR